MWTVDQITHVTDFVETSCVLSTFGENIQIRLISTKAIYKTFSCGTTQRRLTSLCNVNSWVSSNFYSRWPLLLKKIEISSNGKPDPCYDNVSLN